ncbi:MAG: hypothetical protein P8X79_13185 [Reinekea sp.]
MKTNKNQALTPRIHFGVTDSGYIFAQFSDILSRRNYHNRLDTYLMAESTLESRIQVSLSQSVVLMAQDSRNYHV